MGLFIQLVFFGGKKKKEKVSRTCIPFAKILYGTLGMKENKLEYEVMWQGKRKGEKKMKHIT